MLFVNFKMYEISVAFRETRNMQSMHRENYFYSCMCIHVEAPGRILIRVVSNPSEHVYFHSVFFW